MPSVDNYKNEVEYSTLAHLQRGSIIVNVGEAVSRGQPLAKCGNAGEFNRAALTLSTADRTKLL